ncbi:hypothetical protein ACHBTE_04620 [Streptomyces sp. M41]|uniref:hypothetical protein n=1 Tax=Streptomyces sp. M41 TaxID=3059412 RepID=UPI00374DC151
MRIVAVCGAAVLAVVGGAAPGAGAADAPAAGLAYHGSAVLSAGRVDVRFTPRNDGPKAVPDSTVRLRWSAPLAERQTLPKGCARADERTVTCPVGALAAGRTGQRIAVRVRLTGAPSEVLLEFATTPGGGAGTQRVLVLDTGDTYYF